MADPNQPIEPGTILSGTGLTLDYGAFKTVLYQFFLFHETELDQESLDLLARLYQTSPELLEAARECGELLACQVEAASQQAAHRLGEIIARAEGRV